MSILDRAYFRDEEAAYSKLESVLWPYGPSCPHCGAIGDAVKVKANPEKKVRYGLWKCSGCKKQFTVTVGTVFESSHIPLHKWLQAAYLLCSSKKGISAKQIERTMQVTYKSAWFMMHRLREAMALTNPPRMGGDGMTVESDETYIGRREGVRMRRGTDHKIAVLSLVERDGKARSFNISKTSRSSVQDVLHRHLDENSRLMTDEAAYYLNGIQAKEHQTVHHASGEYARGDATTNTVEGFFSIFKRGMKGIYQHCDEKHLHRYLAEFDFRYSNRERLGVGDEMRTDVALAGAAGKRLTYGTPRSNAVRPV